MAESELTVRMRQLREKLLFHVEPPHNGKIWAGLLTADKGVEQGVRVRAVGEGFDVTDGKKVEQTIKVVADGSGKYFNEGDGSRATDNNIWLNPSGIIVGHAEGGGFDWSVQSDRNLYTVSFEASADGITRKERVVIPIFGKAQVKNAGSVFHD